MNIKTQIRFVDRDITLFTKERGTDDPFTPMEMQKIQENANLPPLDMTVTWKKT